MTKVFALCIMVFLISACQNTVDEEFQKEAQFQRFEPPVPYEMAMAKAESILQQMTLEEKIEMIGGHSIFFTRGYEKYGIPSIRFSDATQGVSLIDYKDHLEKSVAFPAPLALTSTWNIDLSRSYAKSVGEEWPCDQLYFSSMIIGPSMQDRVSRVFRVIRSTLLMLVLSLCPGVSGTR